MSLLTGEVHWWGELGSTALIYVETMISQIWCSWEAVERISRDLSGLGCVLLERSSAMGTLLDDSQLQIVKLASQLLR